MDVAECERQTENDTHARITANKSANTDNSCLSSHRLVLLLRLPFTVQLNSFAYEITKIS